MFSKVKSAMELLKGVATNRWMVVVASLLILACSGAASNFGIYSPVIKSSFNYNQETLNTVGFFKDLGSNLGIFSGFLYDLTGPFPVLLCSSLLNLFGYLMVWLSVTGRISAPQLWQICLYTFLGANSQAFANTAAIVTSVKNFPHNRGLVIAVLKGFTGLSGAMLALSYRAVYGDEPSSFILLISWAPSVVSLVFMLVVRIMESGSRPEMAAVEKRNFKVFLYIAMLLAGYLMVIIILEHLQGVRISLVGFRILFATMLAIVLMPLGVVVFDERKNSRTGIDEAQSPASVELSVAPSVNSQRDSELQDSGTLVNSSNLIGLRKVFSTWKRPAIGSDYSIPEAIFSIEMLTIVLALGCGIGSGFMALDNIAQMGAALGHSSRDISTFVSLISIWNFVGRIAAGVGSDEALRCFAVPRALVFAAVLAIAAIGHLVFASALSGSLYAGSILLGVTIGGQWALFFTIISEIFGLRYYGTLFNVGTIGAPLGTYLLSVRVAGYLYDREAAKDATKMSKSPLRILLGTSGNHSCYGSHCYRTSFFIMAGVCAFGCCLALILTARTRRYYREIHLKHKEQLQKAEQN